MHLCVYYISLKLFILLPTNRLAQFDRVTFVSVVIGSIPRCNVAVSTNRQQSSFELHAKLLSAAHITLC